MRDIVETEDWTHEYLLYFQAKIYKKNYSNSAFQGSFINIIKSYEHQKKSAPKRFPIK